MKTKTYTCKHCGNTLLLSKEDLKRDDIYCSICLTKFKPVEEIKNANLPYTLGNILFDFIFHSGRSRCKEQNIF